MDRKRPYSYFVEPERSAAGEVVDVATLFLTNTECPFRCLMCDLWKNTIPANETTGDIVSQIDFALSELPAAKSIKLYNSGNFFDANAIPPSQYIAIAERVAGFQDVVIENHPRLCDSHVLKFRDLISASQLEVAIGLETAHPQVLPALNKMMSLEHYERAVRFLTANGIRVRTFILLRPPFLTEAEGVEWAIKSLEFAFSSGVECCSIVPTRGGNGMMEHLAEQGDYAPPSGQSIEAVMQTGLSISAGRVFMDLWDAERFFACEHCRSQRIERLEFMNLNQICPPPIHCELCQG